MTDVKQMRTGAIARRTMMGLGALALWSAVLPVGAANAEDTLRAITAFPKNLAFSQSFLRFVDKVNAAGKGVVKIDYAGGPEVAPQQQQPDAVRRGVIDMHYGPMSLQLGKLPEADAWVGATVTPMEARKNGGFALMQKAIREKLGAELIGHIDGGVNFYIYLTKEPKRTAEGGVDLSGLKIRSAPIYKAFLNSLGATDVSVPVPEVYGGLERNVFDGAGWPSIGILDLNWNKFLKYRINPGFYATDLAIIVNPAKWAALSPKSREIISKVAMEFEQESFDYFQKEIAATDARAKAAGMTYITLEGAAAKSFLDRAYDESWKRLKASGSPDYEALRKAYYNR